MATEDAFIVAAKAATKKYDDVAKTLKGKQISEDMKKKRWGPISALGQCYLPSVLAGANGSSGSASSLK
eukprot:9593907-Karenia_brevis.AAC.1